MVKTLTFLAVLWGAAALGLSTAALGSSSAALGPAELQDCANSNADVFVTYDHKQLPQSASVIIKGDLSRLFVRYDKDGGETESKRYFSEFVTVCFGKDSSPLFRYSIVDVDFNGMRRLRGLGEYPTRFLFKVREKFRSRADDFWIRAEGEEPSNFFSANFEFDKKFSDCANSHSFTVEVSGRLTGEPEQDITKATEIYLKLFNVRMKNSIQAAVITKACETT